MNWQCLSIEAPPELVESIADVFSRFAAGNVVISSINIEDQIDGPGELSGPMRVSAYLQINEHFEYKKKKIGQAIASLSMIQKIPKIVYEDIQEENWMESWKQHFKALRIGRKFLIQPAWLEPDETTRHIIRIDPGMAFGTGVHPSTQLALNFLEENVKAGISVFDIGCGSGILSIGADLLGAQPVIGVDIDVLAVENAQFHARLNHSKTIFKLGSVKNIAKADFALQKADLVVANILAKILLQLLNDGLSRLVAKDGILILSGILAEQEKEIVSALAEQGFQGMEKKNSEDWIAIKATRN